MTIEQLVKKILGRQIGRKMYEIYINISTRVKHVNTSEVFGKINGDPAALKIIGFVQVYNESENGNLRRCLTHLKRFCDEIVIYDDGSTDDSVSVAKEFTNHIVRSEHNDFKREIFHKQQLLDLALSLNPDWIVWLDADEVFDRVGELGGIRALCQYGSENGIDGFSFQEFNLWMSTTHFRVDKFMFKVWQVRLWRNNGRLRFALQEGLHNRQHPAGINILKIMHTDVKVIHYGWSSEEKIRKKYFMYRSHGQSLPPLEELKYPKGLILKEVRRDWFPPSVLKVSVVCPIQSSIEHANFVLNSFNRHTCGVGQNVGFLFVADKPAPSVLSYLKENKVQHLILPNSNSDDYLHQLYNALKYGANDANGDVLVFVNAYMAFSDGWLPNLLKHLREDRILTSRLVAPAKAMLGKHVIQKDFGRTSYQFDDAAFKEFAKEISSPEIVEGGWFVPCMIYKDVFLKHVSSDKIIGKINSRNLISMYEQLSMAGIKHYTVFDSIVYQAHEKIDF